MKISASVISKKSEKAISKYLQNYAEPEIQTMPAFDQQYQHCLIIPAFNESSKFLESLIQQFHQQNLLIILVINRPEGSTEGTNVRLLLWLQQNLEADSINGNQTLYKLNNHSSLLVINRDSTPIPKQFGVGLARKIAADCAAALIHQGIITSPWIGSTDADTTLPKEYFETFSSLTDSNHTINKDPSAICFPFLHHNSEQVDSSQPEKTTAENIHTLTQVYEAKLHHYVLALRWIGSPYAFHTIGSCLAFHYLYYIQVRGFPKRSAGEDFYLLNKLAKLGDVFSPNGPVLHIQSRLSDRVPFGTGPAVQKLLDESESGNNWMEANLFYNPELFTIIKAINNGAKDFLCIPHQEAATELTTQQQNAREALELQLNLQTQLTKISQQYATPTQRQQAFNNYFDGFRTMKAVHYLRDNGYPNLPLTEVMNAHYLTHNQNSAPRSRSATDSINVQAHLDSLTTQVWHSGN